MNTITLAIHGGAGTIVKEDMTPELEAAYQQGLTEALIAGFAVLELHWTYPRRLRVLGWVLSKRWVSYCFDSHFVMHCRPAPIAAPVGR